jgi:ATP-dependent Lhr-like helicase
VDKLAENVFDLLHSEVRNLAKSRFKSPTPIQELVIPKIIKGKNVLVLSETGSGKTESCLLPIFDHLISKSLSPISTLYITPLKSLNRDLLKRILWWSGKLGFDVSVRHGDTTQYERGMQAQNPPDLLISTPETLQAVLTGKLMREHLKNIRYIVIDEIHELVNNKRGVQLSVGLERLKELIISSGKGKPQIIALSATIGNPEDVAKFVSNNTEIIHAESGEKIKIRVVYPLPKALGSKDSETFLFSPDVRARLEYIIRTINEKESVLVFTNTREAAEILSHRLKILDKNLKIETHHSSLSKSVRIKAEDDFKERKLKALLCTSSLELGIDIGSINFVLQYNSPRQVSKIVQRVGRSGHTLERTSEGVIISTDADDCFESAVIARRGMKGEIEPSIIYGKSLDVLAHQIVGLALEEYKIPFNRAYEIIKRAFPFRNLKKEELFDVCKLLQKLGFIWLDRENIGENEKQELFDSLRIKRRKNAFTYYYSNLSTIPDVKNYKIFDTFSRQVVGTLDAEFVALHGAPDTAFIVKGQSWRVLEITEDKIFVEPLQTLEAAIPAWEGELIPVPYEIAREVGEIRRKIKEEKDSISYLLKNYPIAKEVADMMVDVVKKQGKNLPTDKKILIEYGQHNEENFLVINSCFGSLVNETIGRVISMLLSNKFGSVGLQTDPYRIIFKMKNLSNWRDFVEIFEGLQPKMIEQILSVTMPNTELFYWRFSHVAKRFGIISKNTDFSKSYLRKLVQVYSKTIVHKEVLNEIFHEKLDLKKTSEVLKMIRNGEIGIEIKPELSHISLLGITTRYEVIGSEKPETEIFEIFKKRLLDTTIGLICCNCTHVLNILKVKEVENHILQCPKCGSKLIGVVSVRRIAETKKLLEKFLHDEKMLRNEKSEIERLLASSYLVVASGADAVKVLAARGIGPKTASRILSKMNKGDDLLRDILEAERQFIRTKRFWKD